VRQSTTVVNKQHECTFFPSTIALLLLSICGWTSENPCRIGQNNTFNEQQVKQELGRGAFKKHWNDYT